MCPVHPCGSYKGHHCGYNFLLLNSLLMATSIKRFECELERFQRSEKLFHPDRLWTSVSARFFFGWLLISKPRLVVPIDHCAWATEQRVNHLIWCSHFNWSFRGEPINKKSNSGWINLNFTRSNDSSNNANGHHHLLHESIELYFHSNFMRNLYRANIRAPSTHCQNQLRLRCDASVFPASSQIN